MNLFDFGTAEHFLFVKHKAIDDPKRSVDADDLVAPDFWEEHCVECGAPECYKTCIKYIKSADARCKRFEHGIQPIDLSGHRCFAIQFRPWGKLELHFRGKMVAPGIARIIATIDKYITVLARTFTSCFSWLPTTRNPMALWRSIRWRLVAMLPSSVASPNKWFISCCSSESVELVASVLDENGNEVLVDRLKLNSGWNTISINVPHVGDGSKFRLFSIDGSSAEIIFRGMRLSCSLDDVGEGASDLAKRDASPSVKPAEFVKCLVWDLDNTLWNGILVEDGADGVRIRNEAVDLIKALDARGILNSICSKNDWPQAKDKLANLGILDYFVFPVVNWNPKSVNIRQIAKDINIGLDAIAFVDDSSYEREEVRVNLPMIRVYSENDLAKMSVERCFNPPLSKESSKRRMSYLAEMGRRQSEQSFINREDFLRECNIELTLKELKSEELIQRCWELVNRTNQLTLAARRYGESEFRAFINTKSIATYAIHCKDKYGDYGIVGFIAFSCADSVASICEFVMSCRVAKKLCEQSVLMFLARYFKGKGLDVVEAEIVPTGRNNALIEAFDAMPFSVQETANGNRHYALQLSNVLLKVYENMTRFEDAV